MAKEKYLVITSALLLIAILASFTLAHIGGYDRELPRGLVYEKSYLDAMEKHHKDMMNNKDMINHKDMMRMHSPRYYDKSELRNYRNIEMLC